MNIQLRYFAGIREAVGVSQESISLPEHIRTVDAVRRHLCERGPAWSVALNDRRGLRIALDQQMTSQGAPLFEGCELAFFPPVTGG